MYYVNVALAQLIEFLSCEQTREVDQEYQGTKWEVCKPPGKVGHYQYCSLGSHTFKGTDNGL